MSANKKLCDRYLMLISRCVDFGSGKTSSDHLKWMLNQIGLNDNKWPPDKIGRWLGYVQGVLSCYSIIDVDRERDISRTMFHAEYAKMGLKIPDTIER